MSKEMESITFIRDFEIQTDHLNSRPSVNYHEEKYFS